MAYSVGEPISEANPLPVAAPRATAGGNMSAQTANPGSGWTAFASQALGRLVISNGTGTAIEFQQDATGVALPIPSGAVMEIRGITNANQIRVRRVDQSNTQVTVAARWEG